jgi:hypothetical protein
MKPITSYALYDAKRDRFLNKQTYGSSLVHARSPRLWNAAWKCAAALRRHSPGWDQTTGGPAASSRPRTVDVCVIEMTSAGTTKTYSVAEFMLDHPKGRSGHAKWVRTGNVPNLKDTDGLSVGCGNNYIITVGMRRRMVRAKLYAFTEHTLWFKLVGGNTPSQANVMIGRPNAGKRIMTP